MTEEDLNLLLETTDCDDCDDSSEAGNSGSDVDVFSFDPPGPKATKIDGHDGINLDTTRTDFIQLQNVDCISLVIPSASSPSASPASTPPSSNVNINRKKSVKSIMKGFAREDMSGKCMLTIQQKGPRKWMELKSGLTQKCAKSEKENIFWQ